jgi:hypothetical protein
MTSLHERRPRKRNSLSCYGRLAGALLQLIGPSKLSSVSQAGPPYGYTQLFTHELIRHGSHPLTSANHRLNTLPDRPRKSSGGKKI